MVVSFEVKLGFYVHVCYTIKSYNDMNSQGC